uniref:HAT C-terminal dimerisation domain-containing protein n=1 Tax=Cajanus cajan TaxID=3821 RepID=A0A151QWL0_CAJCA|nr:hypothetical protein KK1_044329 [Cajanus cajan]
MFKNKQIKIKNTREKCCLIRDVLFKLVETSDDPKIKGKVDCLTTYELENFEFLLGMTIWYDIIFVVNSVSKNLQMYRENGFENALIFAKEIAFKMDVESKFCEKHINYKKKQFDESVENEIVKSIQESFRCRFEQFKLYESIFHFLFSIKNLKSLNCVLLKEKCLNLEKSLKHDKLLDLDDLNLFSELNILKEIIGLENDKLIDILNCIKRINSSPNAYIAYRIMLTIPISITSTKRSFSKHKLTKTYLRSTMSQQRLNGLTLLSIEKDMLNEINYDNLIDNFA